MTISDELFKLIKSLTMQEKRYFKLHSSFQKGEKKYIILFDAIERQTVYNESKIVKKYHLKNISVTKSKLSNHILKSLRSFHANKTCKREVEELIDFAEILQEKKQVSLALKCIRKAKKIALDNELYESLLSMSALEMKTLELTLDIAKIEAYNNAEAKNKKRYLNLIKNISEYSTIASKLNVPNFIRSNSKTDEIKLMVKELVKNPLLSSPKKALSFSSLERYYHIHYLCASLINRFSEKDYRRQNEWVTYLENDKGKLNQRWYSYLGAVSRLIIIQNHLNKVSEAERSYKCVVEFSVSLPPAIKSNRLFHYLLNVTGNYIAMQLDILNATKAIEAWDELQTICRQNHIVLKDINSLPLYGNLCYAHFLLQEYREALKYSNMVINTEINSRQDILQMVRLYKLIINYEKGNYEQLPSMTRSLERYIIKYNGSISVFEKLILKYFEVVLPGISNRREEIFEFKKWKQELSHVSGKIIKYSNIGQFDLASWIESKIQNQPIIEVLKKKRKPVGN